VRKRSLKPQEAKGASSTQQLSEVAEKLNPRADVALPRQNENFQNENPFVGNYAATVSDNFTPPEFNVIATYYANNTQFYSNLYEVNTHFTIFKYSKIAFPSKEHSDVTAAFRIKLKTFISSATSYAASLSKFESLSNTVLHPSNLAKIQTSCRDYIKLVKKLPSASEAIIALERYIEFLNKVIAANGKVDHLLDEVLQLSSEVGTSMLKIASSPEDEHFEKKQEVTHELSRILTIIRIHRSAVSEMPNTLHNIESAVIDLRLTNRVSADLPSVTEYLSTNESLLKVQIALLTHFQNTTVKPVLGLWPVLNMQLWRPQSKEVQFKASDLITQKSVDRARFNEAFAQEFLPFVRIINTCDSSEETQAGKESLQKLLTPDASKQNALIRFVILEKIINYYYHLNHVATTTTKMHLEIKSQIQHLNDFVENLKATKDLWNGKVFKHMNDFVYFQRRLQNVIGATEVAFLNCEEIFKHTDKSKLELKNEIIIRQLKILEMQNALLNFARTTGGSDFILSFFFKNSDGSRFIRYDAFKKNRTKALSGDLHNIIQGIPIKEILQRNAMLKLKLEALPMEFQAKQWQPQDSNYHDVMHSAEMEKYLLQWEAEDEMAKEQQRELENKEQKSKAKQKKQLEKRAAKNAEKTKTPAQNPAQPDTRLAKPAARSVDTPIKTKMDKLLQNLNSQRFDAVAVKQVISELTPLTLASRNSEEVFNALSAIGDSYSMIAKHRLKHSKKSPQELLVNLQLGLNFYNRAELVLGTVDGISAEVLNNYYSWLLHSVSMQRQLLVQYVEKYTHQYEKLSDSRERRMQEQGDGWYENHKKPGWKKSAKAEKAEALQSAFKAMRAVSEDGQELDGEQKGEFSSLARQQKFDSTIKFFNDLQDQCKELEARLRSKIHLTVMMTQQAYAFEHYRASEGIAPLPKLREVDVAPVPVQPQNNMHGTIAVIPPNFAVEASCSPQYMPQPAITFTKLVDFNPGSRQPVPTQTYVPPFAHEAPPYPIVTFVPSQYYPAQFTQPVAENYSADVQEALKPHKPLPSELVTLQRIGYVPEVMKPVGCPSQSSTAINALQSTVKVHIPRVSVLIPVVGGQDKGQVQI